MIRVTKEMFESGQPIAQGEVLIWAKAHAPKDVQERVANLKNMKEMKLTNGTMVLGHSETGAHHVLEPVDSKSTISKAAQALIDSANDTFVSLTLHEECKLVHLRGTDTHDGYVLPAGEYIRGLREEQSPEGWRRVAD